MAADALSSLDLSLAAYVGAFGVAAALCFAALARVDRIDNADARRGLVALLVTSGAWALAHVAFLLAPTETLKLLFYTVGLVVGLVDVGAWLYFCSAFTGRSLHRNPTYRRVVGGVLGGIILLKVTNPLHHYYYTTEMVSTPFRHLTVHNEPIHWAVMGLAYALSAVGYFMLFEAFTKVGHETRPLAVLVAVTGLPVLLDVAGAVSPLFIDITYEPLGVAVFAFGVAFVFVDRFEAVRLVGRENPVVVLGEGGEIRDYNTTAADLFPELESAIGTPLSDALPRVAAVHESADDLLETGRNGGRRYYRVTSSTFGAGTSEFHELLVFTDVTHREQYRRELERQNQRLDRFASMVSHDLRNPLTVAKGQVELAREDGDGDGDDEHLRAATEALDRMEALIEDVLAVAREGQPLEETSAVSLRETAEGSWRMVDTRDATLEVVGDCTFRADPDRTERFLENLFRNAVDHGGDDVTVTVGPLDDDAGFYVADDGPGIPPEERETVFEYGYTNSDSGTGFGLAIVSEIAQAHGWDLVVGESESGGACFEVRDVDQSEPNG